MGLKKGMTNNPHGRKKGKPNRSTSEIKTAFQNLLDRNIEQMESDLKTLSPKDRINVLLKLSEFCVPKVSTVQPDGEGIDNKIIIEYVDVPKIYSEN